MRIGQMFRRITIRQQSAPTRNALNEPVRVWTVLGKFWAEEDERAARTEEAIEAGQVRAAEHRTWLIRWTQRTATISEHDRAVCGGVEYEIISAREVSRRGRIEIKATGPVTPAA